MSSAGASARRPRRLAPWQSSLIAILAFWCPWLACRHAWPQAPALALSAQLWLAYSAGWWGQRWRWWPVWVPLFSALGAVASLPLARGFSAHGWADTAWLWRTALGPWAFALLMLLPLRWWQWREQQRLQLRLARAEQQARVAELTSQVSLAELKTLQAQIEPHFLFNTLASLQQLVRVDNVLAERMLGRLHDYLRLAMPTMRTPMSSVQRELDLAEAYLELMAMRMGPRLRYQLKCADGLVDQAMPPMVLATLLENAVRHGIEPLPAGGCIEVDISATAVGCALQVSDDGAGLLHAGAKGAGVGGTGGPIGVGGSGGVGLANLRDRLAAMYGTRAHLQVSQREPAGVCARIEWPHVASTEHGPPP